MPEEIDVSDSVNSGQVFLWKNERGIWRGINGGDVLEAGQDEPSLDERGREFFRLDDDYEGILRDISRDGLIRKSVRRYRGLRLLRQDPFQCYISFIVSSNSNIPNIRTRLERLCKKFGKRVRIRQDGFHVFPSPRRLAGASQAELLECGLGYRAGFVKAASEKVLEKQIDLEDLGKSGYREARDALTAVPGIGGKVADCIMLFSLEKLDAFPLDTWILKALNRHYSERFSLGGKSLTAKRYEAVHDEVVSHFGEYCGYSQQFLFKMMRDQSQRRWM